MSLPTCEIWLEFEQWTSDLPPEEDREYFNMVIRLADGRAYALNVWTFAFAARLRSHILEGHEEEPSPPLFSIGPDLLVEVADRPTLEVIANRLVSEGG